MPFGQVGIVLTGGGLKCCFQVGALAALQEAAIKLVRIQGVSGGCLNAAQFVEDDAMVESLKKIWLQIESDGYSSIFSRWDAFKHGIIKRDNALFSGEGLQKLVNRLNIQKIIQSKILFEAVVYNEIEERCEIFTNQQFIDKNIAQQEKFRQIIKASACLPGFFPPEEIDGQLYSDGCEFFLKEFKDCDNIFIIDPDQPLNETSSNLKDILKSLSWDRRLMRRLTTLVNSCERREIEKFAQENKFQLYPPDEDMYSLSFKQILAAFKNLWKDLIGLPPKKIIIITPSITIPTLTASSFSKGDISKMMQHGMKKTKEILNKLRI